MWESRSKDCVQLLQIRRRQRRHKCKHQEKSETPPNKHSNRSFFQDRSYPPTFPQQSSSLRCHEKGLLDNCREAASCPGLSLAAVPLGRLVPHFASLPTSQTQMHHRSRSPQPALQGFFLFSSCALSQGPSTSSSPVRCSVILSCPLF